MSDSVVPKSDRNLPAASRRIASEDPKQKKLMVGALCLLLLALNIVLWRNRDFWFPDAQNAVSDLPAATSPAAKTTPAESSTAVAKPVTATKSKPKHQVQSAPETPDSSTPPAPVAVTNRTVLPPLDVEVVAGDSHRTIRPGSNSVRLDLQPGTPPQTPAGAGAPDNTEIAANVTTNAAEHLQMSTDASAVVTRPVSPNYPLLARQMKVQGSVILQALIGKDGIIQNLRVVSGPHILASAAQDAVRQWHFKPHFEGSEAVETQAKITVNFTISTN
jgi:TonB family protein